MWKRLFGPQSPEDYEVKAVEALKRGDESEALRWAQECVTRLPSVVEARLFHSKILDVLGRTDEAAATMDAVAERYPTTTWLRKAAVWERAGRVAEALAAYESAVGTDPECADAWLGWATVLADSGAHEAALDKFERAAKLNAAEPITWYNWGNSLSRLRRYEQARKSYERALELGHEGAHGAVRSTLLYEGRIDDANRRRAGLKDFQGEARERRKPLRARTLVARYFTGQHSNPELLDSVVEQMLEHVSKLEDKPPGLAEGVRIQYGWTALTVWERGADLLLCEPDWSVEPKTRATPSVSFSAMQLVMQQLMHNITGAEPRDCSCHDTLLVERGALEADSLVMVRAEPSKPGDSGWSVRCSASAEFPAAEVPMTALVSDRPHLLKVVTFPVGWTVILHGHQVIKVFDPEDKVRFEDR